MVSNGWTSSDLLAWCVRALQFLTLVSKVVFNDILVNILSSFTLMLRLSQFGLLTPTNPAHRGEDERTYKNNNCSHRDVSYSDGGPIVPRQSFGAMSHSRNLRWGRGLREGKIFFTPRHKATKRRSPWLTHGEEKRLSNHNNNHHHPAVSTVATNRDSSPNQYSNTESDHSSRWDNIAVESAVGVCWAC